MLVLSLGKMIMKILLCFSEQSLYLPPLFLLPASLSKEHLYEYLVKTDTEYQHTPFIQNILKSHMTLTELTGVGIIQRFFLLLPSRSTLYFTTIL